MIIRTCTGRVSPPVRSRHRPAGERESADAALKTGTPWALASGTDLALGLLARSRALLTDDGRRRDARDQLKTARQLAFQERRPPGWQARRQLPQRAPQGAARPRTGGAGRLTISPRETGWLEMSTSAQPATTWQNVNDAWREALFASGLQPSDAPTAGMVATAINRALLQFGVRGCVGLVAQEFGDHPDAAASRMRWVRGLAAAL